MNNKIAGFILINKPTNISSYDCIRKIKRILPSKTKIGHAGTLDKEAEGLLIIAIDRSATRVISSIANQDKQYTVTAKLGELTTTLDHAGKIIETTNTKDITQHDIDNAIKALGSEYQQIPPVYSALKHQGQSLYKLARTEKISSENLDMIVQSKARNIKIYNLEVTNFSPPYFTFKAHVSKGTYIRSLANDIAKQFNNFATTYKLCRTHIGKFKLEDAIDINSLQSSEDIKSNIISAEDYTI